MKKSQKEIPNVLSTYLIIQFKKTTSYIRGHVLIAALTDWYIRIFRIAEKNKNKNLIGKSCILPSTKALLQSISVRELLR